MQTLEVGTRVIYTHNGIAQPATVRHISEAGDVAIVALDGGGLIATATVNLTVAELLPCGHPVSAVRGEGATHWCSECQKEAEAE
jgi:hypothetical protein